MAECGVPPVHKDATGTTGNHVTTTSAHTCSVELFGSVTLHLPFTSVPFRFRSVSVAIRCIPFRSRDTPTAKGQKWAHFAGHYGSQTRSDDREKANQG